MMTHGVIPLSMPSPKGAAPMVQPAVPLEVRS